MPSPGDQPLVVSPAAVLLRNRDIGEQQRQQLTPLLDELFSGLARGEVAIPAPSEELLGGLRNVGLLADPAPDASRRTQDPVLPPLVLKDGQLWLGRFQRSMEACLERLAQMAQAPPLPPEVNQDDAVPSGLPGDIAADEAQRQAFDQWRQHRLLVLTGGPGTGKTTLVGSLLAADPVRGGRERIRVRLAAPTGKAAARLQETLHDASRRLGTRGEPLSRLRATTLHRLLEIGPGGPGRTTRRPIPADTVVVDEISMVDLPLLQMVVEALEPQARLLLLGDPGQLPPIGLGDPMAAIVKAGHGVVTLRTVFRNRGAIAAVAQQLRSGCSLHGIRHQLERLQPQENVEWQCGQPPHLPHGWRRRIQRHCRQLRSLASNNHVSDAERLAGLEAMVLLSATRHGGWGVEALNRQLLGLVPGEPLPAGAPVMCTRNSFSLDLANGDVGLVLNPHTAVFRTASGPRRFALQRLPSYEPALALTIHKSQGSQYGEVVLLWSPPAPVQDPTALLYTGITRARERVYLLSDATSFDGDIAA